MRLLNRGSVMFLAVPFAAFFLLLAAVPAFAHHSFIGKYDATRVVTIKGVVSSVDWRNPHIFFTVDAEKGGSWRVEAEGIAKTSGKGLTEGLLKPGTAVTVRGWPAVSGKAEMGLQSITLPGGRTIKLRGTAR